MNPLNNAKRFRGIRMHGDIAAPAIGAETVGQQNKQANEAEELQNPITGGIEVQDRLKRYGGSNAQ